MPKPIIHSEMVTTLAKSGEAILVTLTPDKANLMHIVPCIGSEAGELFDAIKKHVIYGKPMDRENVVEELGDLEFYLEATRQALNITREETLAANIAKLSKRYGEALQYSDESAQARADKVVDSAATS